MTPVLTPVIAEVERRCRGGIVVSLFLDFDGTLVPIAPDPATPKLDASTEKTLRTIVAKPHFVTTIISGRAVDDLHMRIRIPGIIYAGNHGLEILGRNLCFSEPVAAALRERLAAMSENLENALQTIPGALVEYKGVTTSVHFRRVADEDAIARMRDVVRNAVARDNAFRVRVGRKVFEIVPRTDWNKGTAALWINRHLGQDELLSIFIGDDRTDEDAFEALTDGITVKVGGCETRAKYRVPGPEAVQEFLQWLAEFEWRSGNEG
jgi:trehalose-phosphatase